MVSSYKIKWKKVNKIKIKIKVNFVVGNQDGAQLKILTLYAIEA